MSEQEKYDLIVKASDLLYRVFEGKKKTHSEILEKALLLLPIITPTLTPGTLEYQEILNGAIDLFEREVGIKTFDPDIIDKDYDQDLWLYKVKPTIPHAYFDRYKLYLRKEGFSIKVIEEDIAPTCEKILSR